MIQPSICPIQRGVHHKSPSHVHNCLNSTLSPSILTLRSNARKGLRLPFIYTLLAIFLSQENPIIFMVVFDLRITYIPKPLLKMSFPHHGLICTKWHLIFYPNEPWHGIVVNCSTLKTLIRRFTPITLRQSVRSPADEIDQWKQHPPPRTYCKTGLPLSQVKLCFVSHWECTSWPKLRGKTDIPE